MVTSLDRKLSGILKPLVGLGAVVRVSQFPNTLCLGFHYLLAHGESGMLPRQDVIPEGRIDLADWNHPNETIQRDKKYLNGVYLLYQPKGRADKLRNQQLSSKSFFGSVPVTRFRPRWAFLHVTEEAKAVVSNGNNLLSAELIRAIIERGFRINVQTDVPEQAEALIERLVGADLSHVRFVGAGWPLGAAIEEEQITLLIYGAPCTAYMRRNPEVFIPLEIEDSLVSHAAAFETHAVWIVPHSRHDDNGVIRQCMMEYHQLLYEASAEANSAHLFVATRSACNEVLGRWHPSFPHRVLASVHAFQEILREHHLSPN